MTTELIISDLTAATGKEYFTDCGGFKQGALQYIDRDYVFDYIPDVAKGQTHIRTAGNDKMIDENDLCLSFRVDVPVTVFVVYADKLWALPRWLREFRDTRQKVTRTDSNTSTLKGISTLFSKGFPPGVISLNGNLSEGMADDPQFNESGLMGANYCMYSVVVKEL